MEHIRTKDLVSGSLLLTVAVFLVTLSAFTEGQSLEDKFRDDPLCGKHPMKEVIRDVKQASPEITEEKLMSVLKVMKGKMPAYWANYERKLAEFKNCVIMSESGHFGK